jgi:hypothetical protein
MVPSVGAAWLFCHVSISACMIGERYKNSCLPLLACMAVKKKMRVKSVSDPSLMIVMAKVSALEHGVRQLGRALGTVMGVEGKRDGEDES